MSKQTPLQTVHDVDEAFNRGDLEAVLDCYEDQALMVIEPGKVVQGKVELRKTFQELLKLGFKATQLKTETLTAGDIALFISRWRLDGQTAEGKEFSKEFTATTVFRKQLDGQWKAIIDNSFGPDILNTEI
jgi:uncharacterized protein (TIGR02246 family)